MWKGAIGMCIPGGTSQIGSVVDTDVTCLVLPGRQTDEWVPSCVGLNDSADGFKDELTPMCLCGAPNASASYIAQGTVGHCSTQTAGASPGSWSANTTDGTADRADLPACETDGTRNSVLCKCNSKYYVAGTGFCSRDTMHSSPRIAPRQVTPGPYAPMGIRPRVYAGTRWWMALPPAIARLIRRIYGRRLDPSARTQPSRSRRQTRIALRTQTG